MHRTTVCNGFKIIEHTSIIFKTWGIGLLQKKLYPQYICK